MVGWWCGRVCVYGWVCNGKQRWNRDGRVIWILLEVRG